MNYEPAPPLFSSKTEERTWGYGVYSCRYGNIYTTRQLIQLFDESSGMRSPQDAVWEKRGRFFDALRPNIDPVGQSTEEKIRTLRQKHLSAVYKMFCDLDIFIFTLGLTEGWVSKEDGTIYPMAPGVSSGRYDENRYEFFNLTYNEVYDDLLAFTKKLKAVNEKARLLLTVSPVPLAATASESHVLVASTYSKSTLRAVAGDMSRKQKDVFYFPSYELISTHPSRAAFYEPDLRNINMFGVDFVMKNFFSGSVGEAFDTASTTDDLNIVCDESVLDDR
jgi:hypothetical protein